MHPLRSLLFASLVILPLPLLGACGTIVDRNPAPTDTGELAVLPGLPETVRFWGDEAPEAVIENLRTSTKEETKAQLPAWVGTKHFYLALSGGGQNGAFGAGLLNGWTETGTRPEFLIVTGVSTGALIAPFAFLGPEYDEELKKVYTTLRTEDVLERRSWTRIITGDAAVSTQKLRALIDRFLDEEMIERIAAEHERGRRLFIGTTNLDTRRPVIWSITAIAASDYPRRRELIGDILLASASIPGAFPPVFFDVTVDGKTYDELHVDGGTVAQVFVYPSALDFRALLERLDVPDSFTVFIIRNGQLRPRPEPVEPTIFALASTSISSLIRTQGIGDLSQIFQITRRDGGRFRLAYIPDDFDVEPEEVFDPEYMNALYDLGYELAREGYPWNEVPPGYETVDID